VAAGRGGEGREQRRGTTKVSVVLLSTTKWPLYFARSDLLVAVDTKLQFVIILAKNSRLSFCPCVPFFHYFFFLFFVFCFVFLFLLLVCLKQ
jgi:hypothetical protein